MEEAMTRSYFRHNCCRVGNPIMAVELTCPFCQSGFIEELEFPNTARDNDDNDNSYYNGKFRDIDLEDLFAIFTNLNLRRFPNDDDDDDTDDNGISHHRSETDVGGQLFIIDQGIFCHDHKKCIESQQRSGKNSFDLDLVLPGHEHGPDSVCTAEHQKSKQAKADLYSPRCYPEQVELPMADLLISSTDQTSPPCSPLNSDFTPSTPFALEYEVVEFKLKEEEEEEEDI